MKSSQKLLKPGQKNGAAGKLFGPSYFVTALKVDKISQRCFDNFETISGQFFEQFFGTVVGKVFGQFRGYFWGKLR